jgi:hypothetical protein
VQVSGFGRRRHVAEHDLQQTDSRVLYHPKEVGGGQKRANY